MTPRILLSVFALLIGSAARAADTVESFERGITDYELHSSHHLPRTGAPETELTAVVGAGLGDRVALSTAISLDPLQGGDSAFAGAGVWVGAVLGDVALDLLGELGWGVGSPVTEWGLGFELDDRRRALVPYLRTMAWAQGAGALVVVEPTVGLALRPGEARFQPHLELSTSVGSEGMGSAVISMGPNMVLADWVEMVPDITVGLGPNCDCGWAFTLGFIGTLGT